MRDYLGPGYVREAAALKRVVTATLKCFRMIAFSQDELVAGVFEHEIRGGAVATRALAIAPVANQ